MGQVTNSLLAKLASAGEWAVIVDDDIKLTDAVIDAAYKKINLGYQAICFMPVPDSGNMEKYYRLMYSYYEKNDIEPMTFSCIFLSPFVQSLVRIPNGVDAREEHAFHKQLEAHNLSSCTPFNVHCLHEDKDAAKDAKHQRWYADGMRIQGEGNAIGAFLMLLVSPLEGMLYCAGINDIFGFFHTINLRYNYFLGSIGIR
jgi:hypothetical protein